MEIIDILILILLICMGLYIIYYSYKYPRYVQQIKYTKEELSQEIKKNKQLNSLLSNLNTDLDDQKKQQVILNQVINCASEAFKGNDAFQHSMKSLAKKLRDIFKSEYCSIGTVVGNIVQDRVFDFEQYEQKDMARQQLLHLETVKTTYTSDKNCMVCKALKTSDSITRFSGDSINRTSDYFKSYMYILKSKKIKNTTIIPIREKKKIYGFIQFINSEETIKYPQFKPFMKALIGLTQSIIEHESNLNESIKKQRELLLAEKRDKDAKFYNDIQDNKDSIDDLLENIMNYLSVEFNAAVISFRIPILNEENKSPIFLLRKCYVHESIARHDALINHYYNHRLIKYGNELGGYDKLKCCNRGNIIVETARDSDYYPDYNLDLKENTYIMPILRDFDEAQKCYRTNKNVFCKKEENPDCTDRFKKLYGIFKLRLFNQNNDSEFFLDKTSDDQETKKRLLYLSKQISLLLNTIVDKHENESLKTFQKELKNSSFIKIQNFDERCVEIIKKSVHANICSIFRYDKRSKLLSLSATTLQRENSNVDNNQINSDKFSFRVNLSKLAKPSYIYDLTTSYSFSSLFIDDYNDALKTNKSAIIIPMRNKDKTLAGIVLLLGKDKHKHSISTAYWEHDIKHIEFIVNILTRISESDTERLTFLSQLSHELLAPVTELVYDNDYTVEIAGRNIDVFSKRQLVAKLRDNIDRNMLFKYIIDDTEFIYSSSGTSIEYNIIKQNKPQEILLDAIRLMEKEAHEAKGLSIITYISQMPPLYFDKERMMQVFLNLLKNAIRYSDKNTEISISYNKLDNGFHEICFANYGIGIKEEEQETIFELFHRGEEAKRRFVRGTGMGLYIVRDIMRAHGGVCRVKRLANPTEFAITLPR